MREQRGIAIQPGPLPRGDGLTEVFGVPVDDDGGEQVEAGHAVVLTLGGTVADFALPPDAQGVFQGVMRFTLVQANLGPPLHVGVEEPFDDEEGALNAVDFAERQSQLVLARIGGELLEQLTGRHDACHHGCGSPQHAGPILDDKALSNLATDQAAQFVWRGRRVEEVEPSGWQVADARNEPEPEQRGHGKDVIGEAAAVGILFCDLPPGIVHQQPVKNVGCLTHGGRNVLGRERAKLVGDMGVGLEARLGAVFRVDEVHGFALPCGGEELPIAGRSHATTP